ncbi:hypothetical protein LCGC14_1896440 [marine sediment metagenome]|uniref:Uncharacterized protein n=1 Tax=marine sediment metagenome TaxID=412755 RepID=A0A0F9IW32_9ZZZZ
MNEIKYVVSGWKLKSKNIKFEFEAAEGGLFWFNDANDENILVVLTYKQAQDLARLINYVKSMKVKK